MVGMNSFYYYYYYFFYCLVAYEVKYCYKQNEDNDSIFSKEIKPLILGVFEG
jgi:hypothetical protein